MLPALRLAAATVLVAAAGLPVWSPTPAAAAASCADSGGVTVVTDYNGLGGYDVRSACVATGGGHTARDLFGEAGFPLTPVSGGEGYFVCRISGLPAGNNCGQTPPASAYWGLWWSDGKGGWSYASRGADSLTVPAGGSVAFAWDEQAGAAEPGMAPARVSPTPSPTPSPTNPAPTRHTGGSGGGGAGGGTGGGTGGATGGATGATGGQGAGTGPVGGSSSAPTHSTASPAPASASPSGRASSATAKTPSASASTNARAKPRGERHRRPAHASASPTAAASEPAASTSAAAAVPGPPPVTAAEHPDGGLPTWVAPAAVALLFAGAGGAGLVRRRRGNSGP